MRDDTLDLALAAYDQRLARDAHLPLEQRRREAARALLRVATARSPGVVRFIEAHREPTEVDELIVRRLRERARATIDAVVREANAAGADITPGLLAGPCSWPWLVVYRDETCWLLSRDGMSARDIALVIGKTKSPVLQAIRRHAARIVEAAAANKQKESANGA